MAPVPLVKIGQLPQNTVPRALPAPQDHNRDCGAIAQPLGGLRFESSPGLGDDRATLAPMTRATPATERSLSSQPLVPHPIVPTNRSRLAMVSRPQFRSRQWPKVPSAMPRQQGFDHSSGFSVGLNSRRRGHWSQRLRHGQHMIRR